MTKYENVEEEGEGYAEDDDEPEDGAGTADYEIDYFEVASFVLVMNRLRGVRMKRERIRERELESCNREMV